MIEAPTEALPGTETLRHRIHTVREEHADAQHVWFLKRDIAHVVDTAREALEPVSLTDQ
ncbi:hypothetical protein ACFU8Q_35310 [Streptomyces sp. NPDC057543]|uniref:hypothetical protein n=1 Tax=Streptomyces sp. NPDC057543 TaxID=3346163 RepID=UPI0036743E0E